MGKKNSRRKKDCSSFKSDLRTLTLKQYEISNIDLNKPIVQAHAVVLGNRDFWIGKVLVMAQTPKTNNDKEKIHIFNTQYVKM